jgi:hypothetical protein
MKIVEYLYFNSVCMRVKYFLMVVLLLVAYDGMGQRKHSKNNEQEINQTFMNTLMGVISFVPDDFDIIRGEQIKTTGPGTRYRSKWKVAQTESSTIVHDTTWWFEALIHKDTSKTKLADYYKEYAWHLRDVRNAEYTLTEQPNSDPTLQEQPDLIYRYKTGAVIVSLKARRSETGVYSLMVYVMKGQP